jgi:hypothetical protein
MLAYICVLRVENCTLLICGSCALLRLGLHFIYQVGQQFLLEVGVREVPQASVVLQRFAANATWDAAIK